ncbi:DUF885 family protein [Pedobacter sp. HMF7647]|uniref:DUF885 family protein n=1 Tax=Hufsiella arboris TaxID=2695275 RepID=A0A7K1Y4S1_9SPHI|nr:DUF885 domain-containing protein [Hufsiella arboris]MXV49576.1 DUF885 family protein [Hufsiella arboris]
MKKILFLFSLAAMVTCCNNVQNKSTGTANDAESDAKFNSLLSNYWETRSRLFPLDATQQGDNRYNNILPNDQTQSFRDSVAAFYQEYADRLKTFRRAELNSNDQLSYDILNYELDMKIKAAKLGLVDSNGGIQTSYMIPFQQFWGLPLTMGQLGSGEAFQPFKTVKDYENWIGRMRGFKSWSDSAVVNFSKGMKQGIVLPKALVVKMIPQMDAMVVTAPEKSLFYGPVNRFPKEFTAEEKARLTALYKDAIMTQVVPAYKNLGDFLKTEYLPAARNSTGISAVPNGGVLYTYLVKYWTTTDKTPDEIYQTGLNEVKRIHNIMDSVKNSVAFKGDLKAFFNYMRSDKRFYPYKTPEEVLAAFEAIHQKMKPNLEKMYGRVPKTPFEIRQTEAFRAASASAEYNQGSPDGTRPGIFYIPIVDAKKFNTTSGMESLFLHEAIPGHHYQISLQQENTSLPQFRRFAWYGAYGEGYALYSESLGKELGLYTDPYQYMGALGDEIHRAIRLVVDVGMHTKNMTREQAIKYMMDNEALDEAGTTAEIERYMAVPAQALSYKIGALKIRELRHKYEKELGNKFKISSFHDEFLKDGCMPLSILEKKMDDWARSEK